MTPALQDLMERVRAAERELERELERRLRRDKRWARDWQERFRLGAWAFLRQAGLKSLLVAPVIYSLLLPLALLDLWIRVFQAVCFPIYGIEKVRRADYFRYDRGRLPYLNWIEAMNCDYCAYANGVVAWAREVASRAEQYFCPIKHARARMSAHPRYPLFLDYGDAEAYRKRLPELRRRLRQDSC